MTSDLNVHVNESPAEPHSLPKRRDREAPAEPQQSRTPPRIAVVGGGLAGIAATVQLALAGLSVDLYEANRRLGGRVGSFEDPESGERYDYCQHVGMLCCTNLLHLIDLLQQRAHWSIEESLHFYDANGRHLPLKSWPLPAPLHLSGLLLKWPGLSVFERLNVGGAVLKLMRLRQDDPVLTRRAIDWLSRHQSANAIATFWSTILVSALGETIDRVALGPARKVILDGFANNRYAYKLIVPQRPLSELFDCSIHDWLKQFSNVRVLTGQRVDRIEPEYERDGKQACRITLGNQPNRAYDAAVVCVPWYRLGSLLALQDDAPARLETSPITGLHTWWDKSWLPQPHAILVERLCQWIFAKHGEVLQATQASAEESYYQIVISSSRDFVLRDPAEIEYALKEDLKKIFPAIERATLRRCRVVTDPRAVFSVTPESGHGRWSSDKFAEQQVWLAGDWTATGWPATMEGAIRSGFLAARQVAARFGKQLDVPVADLAKAALVRVIQ